MKTLLLSFALILSSTSFAQLEVIETKKEVVIFNSLKDTRLVEFYNEDGGTRYALYFRNVKYQAIVDIQFISFANKAELTQFFELCRKAFADKSKGTIRTPKYSLTKSALGQVEVYNDASAYFYLLLKDVDKMESNLEEKGAK